MLWRARASAEIRVFTCVAVQVADSADHWSISQREVDDGVGGAGRETAASYGGWWAGLKSKPSQTIIFSNFRSVAAGEGEARRRDGDTRVVVI